MFTVPERKKSIKVELPNPRRSRTIVQTHRQEKLQAISHVS
jgi:hypothetical protein